MARCRAGARRFARWVTIFVLMVGWMIVGTSAEAQEAKATDSPPVESTDLSSLSIEELMQIKVTSVSKKPEKQFEAPAAIFTITQEDIRRSGASSIPEVLRIVPGLQVARIDANRWAITSRGFNEQWSNKLLVLIDGRSVYTHQFGGVYWDMQEIPLDDIERIEVIRGPGGTLWGANAVNGVINIITKRAQDTQGGLLAAGIGTENRLLSTLRYGDKVGERFYYRLYLNDVYRDDGVFHSGDRADDASDLGRVGFRTDYEMSEEDSFTFEGDVFEGDSGQMYKLLSLWPPYSWQHNSDRSLEGGNALVRWQRRLAEDSNLAAQVYFDKFRTDSVVLSYDSYTLDFDFQHRFPVGTLNDIVWGAGYRNVHDDARNSFDVGFDPASRTDHLWSAFFQDEIALAGSEVKLTVGSKFEHNNYTQFEVQPNLRLTWRPDDRKTFWAAVSRAVRTPARVENDVRLAQLTFPFVKVGIIGNPDMDAEELLAYEAGFRMVATERVAFDIAAFYNRYDDLRTIELGTPFLELWPLHLTVPAYSHNNADATASGLELSAQWQPLQRLRLRGFYSPFSLDYDSHPRSIDFTAKATQHSDPRHQVGLETHVDLPKNLELDAVGRFVDALPSLDVDSYVELDLRLGWRPTPNLEAAIVGQNLLHEHHEEFVPSFVNTLSAEVQRGVYGKVTWRF